MKYPDEFNTRGVAEYKKGNYLTAIKCFKKAVLLNNTYLDAYLNLAVTYSDCGLSDDSSRAFSKLNALDPYFLTRHELKVENRISSVQEQIALGNMLIRDHKFFEAITVYRKVVNEKPGYADAWNLLGEAYLYVSDIENAKKCFREALGVNPVFAQAKKNVSFCCYREGMKNLRQGLKKEAYRCFIDSIEADCENSRARLHINILKQECRLEIPCTFCNTMLALDWNYCPSCGLERKA